MFELTLLLWALLICNVQGFSHRTNQSTLTMNRSHFIEHVIIGGITATIATHPTSSNAIEFVPSSPSFSYTYKDAVEIIQTQRLAVDNISTVIKEGNIEEAGFKVMQLNAQTRTAGKIILDTFQEDMSTPKNSSIGSESSITLLRFLSVQKKFIILIDLCDECEDTLQMALKGKSGATAAVQLKALKVVDNIKYSYDDFLTTLTSFGETVGK